MGYSPEHKQQTRARIVDAARRLWKAKGYAKVSIGELMKAANLTHGGFYAHFKSKDELFAEAALDTQILERYRAMAVDPSVSPLSVFEMVLDTYLSAGHRDNPSEGCPLVALSEDAWRMGKVVQSAYTKLTDTAIKQLTHVLSGDAVLARTSLAAMVGAVQLARGVGDEAQSLQILEDTKTTLMKIASVRLVNPAAPPPTHE
jgi:TetR/AcrR family transcriptional repressor of nem operon